MGCRFMDELAYVSWGDLVPGRYKVRCNDKANGIVFGELDGSELEILVLPVRCDLKIVCLTNEYGQYLLCLWRNNGLSLHLFNPYVGLRDNTSCEVKLVRIVEPVTTPLATVCSDRRVFL